MKNSTKTVAALLRDQRASRGYSTSYVVDVLKNKFGICISEKTLYGYENGVSTPRVTIFIALCTIYQVGNLSSSVGYATTVSIAENENSWTADEYHDFFNASLLEKVYILLNRGVPDFEGYKDKLSDLLPSDSNAAHFERLYGLFRRISSEYYESAFFVLEQVANGEFPNLTKEEHLLLSAYRKADIGTHNSINKLLDLPVADASAISPEEKIG